MYNDKKNSILWMIRTRIRYGIYYNRIRFLITNADTDMNIVR